MTIKKDYTDAVETSINEEDSDEDIVTEYVENEKIDEEYEKRCSPIKDTAYFLKQVSEHLLDTPCCTKNCCGSWKESDLVKHAEDINNLSRNEKKLVLLTLLRNSAIDTKSTRYSEQRQRLRFTFCYEPFGIMCSHAFQVLFDIRIKELKGLLAHLKASSMSIVPPQHGNLGKKACRFNSLTGRGVSENLIEFMLALGESQGEFSPGRHAQLGNTSEDKNPDTLWLPACFTRSSILRMYNKEHPDFIGVREF